jgi:hypothetical protein
MRGIALMLLLMWFEGQMKTAAYFGREAPTSGLQFVRIVILGPALYCIFMGL